MLYKLRRKIGEYVLRKKYSLLKREKQILNYAASKNIGILFNASDNEDFELIKKYIKYLRDFKKKVKAIGFYDKKQLPPVQLEYDFLTKKQLNWYLTPPTDQAFIANFINEEFDILINFDMENSFPLLYMAALSKAKFKIAEYNEKYIQYYDFLLDIEKERKLKYFMRNADHYLTVINTSNSPKEVKNPSEI